METVKVVKVFKVLMLIFVGIYLTGCNLSPSSQSCKDAKWDGIVISKHGNDMSCSNGDLSPSKKSFITSSGNVPVEHYLYLTFPNSKD